jgi:hypothetical protein
MKFTYSLFSPQVCPYCDSTNIRRSRREGPIEFFLHWFTLLSPYRCRDCYQRYFGFRYAHTPSQTVPSTSK